MASTLNTVNLPYNYTLPTGVTNSTLTYTNGTTASWVQPNLNFQNGNGKQLMTIPHGAEKIVLEKEATLEVQGSVKINGLDLEERLSTIERVLGIPERDVIMEAKYPSLKKKFDDYINTLEKYRTFERIKGE